LSRQVAFIITFASRLPDPMNHATVFIYGTFMSSRVLKEYGIECALTLPAKLSGYRLSIRPRVNLQDAALELVVESSDRAVLADVRVRQSARDNAADMRRFFEHDDLCAALRRCHRRSDSRGIGRDNNDIRLLDRERCGEGEETGD